MIRSSGGITTRSPCKECGPKADGNPSWGPLLVVLASSILMSCDRTPSIEASSPEACKDSFKAVASSAADSSAFANAVAGGVTQSAFADLEETFSGLGSAFDEDAPTVRRPSPESDYFFAFCRAAEGMDAEEISESSDFLARAARSILREESDRAFLRSLREAKERHEVVQDSLMAFEVERAELLQPPRRWGSGLDATIVLEVENQTEHPVSRAYFNARVVSEGRSVPWIEESLNYSIPGGIEPGETATWQLNPSFMQSSWGSVQVPEDAELRVEVVQLCGPDGEPLWGGARWSQGDQRLLDSLSVRYEQ